MSVCSYISKTTLSQLHQILCTLPATMAGTSSDGVAIAYVMIQIRWAVPTATLKMLEWLWYTSDWTTAMQYWLASQLTWYAVYSRYSMQRHDLSTICVRMTTSPMRWRHCTGCASRNVCSKKSNLKFLHGSAARYLGPPVAVADLPGWRALRSASTSR